MPRGKKNKVDDTQTTLPGAILGFEQKLWEAADKLRGSMDPSEYKHVVLGLLFLKYISDAFDQQRRSIEADGGDPEDRDEYTAAGCFWVPPHARWKTIQASAKQPGIGTLIDDAMDAIEKDNPRQLKGVLPRDYGRPALDKQRLGGLIDVISGITLYDPSASSRDLLGRVYEYFLGKFASAEGRLGGDFYTPQSVVRTLVEMIEPYKGRIYDPCCGSGGMFVQSEKFAEAHGGKLNDLSVYGQEFNATTWRLCRMNLAIRGIEADLGPQWADTLLSDQHPALKADFILANPPFNISDWGAERVPNDVRWKKYGTPPRGNANFAWLQHIAHHLTPGGVAGVVLANGSMSSQQSGEGEIRQKMVEDDLIDCMVALPGQLFYATQIPVCLWLLTRSKKPSGLRDRRGQVLFLDARKMGTLVDRVHRELSDADIQRLARTYHAWRGQKEAGAYEDVAGFCKSASLQEIESHGFVLTPGRYVGAEEAEEDGEGFEEKMKRLTKTLEQQFAEGARLEKEIRKNLGGLGYGG